jgi:hypothetical protein
LGPDQRQARAVDVQSVGLGADVQAGDAVSSAALFGIFPGLRPVVYAVRRLRVAPPPPPVRPVTPKPVATRHAQRHSRVQVGDVYGPFRIVALIPDTILYVRVACLAQGHERDVAVRNLRPSRYCRECRRRPRGRPRVSPAVSVGDMFGTRRVEKLLPRSIRGEECFLVKCVVCGRECATRGSNARRSGCYCQAKKRRATGAISATPA